MSEVTSEVGREHGSMTDLIPTTTHPLTVTPDTTQRAVWLALFIPQAAIPKKLTLPTIADLIFYLSFSSND